jgi:hypothetical protein
MLKLVKSLVFLAITFSLAACASQPDEPAYFVFTLNDQIPSFFLGIGHGLIAPFAVVANLVYKVRIYEWPNPGRWYDCGFVLGIFLWGGIGAASHRSQ